MSWSPKSIAIAEAEAISVHKGKDSRDASFDGSIASVPESLSSIREFQIRTRTGSENRQTYNNCEPTVMKCSDHCYRNLVTTAKLQRPRSEK